MNVPGRRIHVVILCLLPVLSLVNTGCRQSPPAASTVASEKKTMYRCPMHTSYTSDKPGNCPICSMALVPFDPNDAAADHAGHVTITDLQRDALNVSAVAVERRLIGREVRASARVAHDPELYAAVKEYQAIAGEDTLNGTRRALELRLKQMGLSDQQLAEAANPNFDPSNYLIGSSRNTVWAYIEVYDVDVPLVKPGSRVVFESPALAGRTLSGRVLSMDPVINAETRTARVRCEIQNDGGALKPGMYLTAVIHGAQKNVLAVPTDALMRTGARTLVYVEESTGSYAPREISTGIEAESWTEVRSGLQEGERVVEHANFLIDAESRLRETAHGH